MCGLWNETGIWRNFPQDKLEEEIPSDILFNFITEIKKYRPFVLLTGGEPLLSKNWYKLAEYLKKNNLSVNISTNGTLLSRYAEEIVDVVDNLDVSIDGIGEIHNRIRGAKEVFEKIEEGLEKIENLKTKKTKYKPNIKISCTINNENFLYLEKIPNYFENKKIRIKRMIFRHLEWTDLETVNSHMYVFEKEFSIKATSLSGFVYQPHLDIDKLIEMIKFLKRKKYKNIERVEFLPEFNYKEIKEFYKNSQYIPLKYRKFCFAPYLGISLLPDGNIWSCPDYIIGNIKNENFEKIWNNEKIRKLRKRIKERGLFPICHACASLYIY